MLDFPTLVQQVFVGRMSGTPLSPEQTNALSHWIDRQPLLHAPTQVTERDGRGLRLRRRLRQRRAQTL
jgi:hypothetical protein